MGFSIRKNAAQLYGSTFPTQDKKAQGAKSRARILEPSLPEE